MFNCLPNTNPYFPSPRTGSIPQPIFNFSSNKSSSIYHYIKHRCMLKTHLLLKVVPFFSIIHSQCMCLIVQFLTVMLVYLC